MSEVRQILASRWDVLLAVAAGGAVGSAGRWALAGAVGDAAGGFPWATFLENTSGAFALGMLMVFLVDVWPPTRYLRPFLSIGVLGGYTTFSTYALDTRALIAADRAPLAAAYLFGTLAVGLLSVWLGVFLARLAVAPSRRRRRRQRQGPAHPDDQHHNTRRRP